MFRRRRSPGMLPRANLRRPGFFGPRLGPRVPLAEGPRQALQQANQLLAEGEYEQAAVALSELADLAAGHGLSERAARLNVQAGRAMLEAGDGAGAAARARRAMVLLVQAGQPGRAAQLLLRALPELRARGFSAEAEALEAEANQRLAGRGLSLDDLATRAASRAAPAGAAARRRDLPASCPRCGSPLRPDEVEWLDDRTAGCDYCGSPVRAG